MNLTFTPSKLFVLIAVIIWLVVAIIGIVSSPLDNAFEWSLIGLASFGISFLP